MICSNCKKDVEPTEGVDKIYRDGELIVDGWVFYLNSVVLDCPECAIDRLGETTVSVYNLKTSPETTS